MLFYKNVKKFKIQKFYEKTVKFQNCADQQKFIVFFKTFIFFNSSI